MNMWIAAATALLVCLLPCGIACVSAKPVGRLVAVEMATVLSILSLLLLAKGFHRPSFFDLALTMTVLSLPGSLLFVHYLERWR